MYVCTYALSHKKLVALERLSHSSSWYVCVCACACVWVSRNLLYLFIRVNIFCVTVVIHTNTNTHISISIYIYIYRERERERRTRSERERERERESESESTTERSQRYYLKKSCLSFFFNRWNLFFQVEQKMLWHFVQTDIWKGRCRLVEEKYQTIQMGTNVYDWLSSTKQK